MLLRINTFLALFTLIFVHQNDAAIPNCSFWDTVELTENNILPNGTYQYEDFLIPSHLIGEYDFEILSGGKKVSVPNHIRGCICKIKTCVRFCCHPDALLDVFHGKCLPPSEEMLQYDPNVNITFANGSSLEVDVLSEFALQPGVPCLDLFALNAEYTEADHWQLFENGTLLITNANSYLAKSEYCLQPNGYDGYYELKPHYCLTKVSEPKDKINFVPYAMIISLVFFILTIIVYSILPELQDIQGLSLICYLISLTIGFSVLALINFDIVTGLSKTCTFMGYFGYFGIASAFAWITVINYDIWISLGGANYNPRRFKKYSLIAWGSVALLTALIILIDSVFVGGEWSPNVRYTCWIGGGSFKVESLYYYVPMLLITLCNLVFFIISARRISQIKEDLSKMNDQGVSVDRRAAHLQSFWLYIRLFLAMGIIWLFEVLSFFIAESFFTTLVDTLNSLQGVIIFIIFVLRRKVKNMLIKRFTGKSPVDQNEPVSLLEIRETNVSH